MYRDRHKCRGPISHVLQDAWKQRMQGNPSNDELVEIIKQIVVWREEAAAELLRRELSLTIPQLRAVVRNVPEWEGKAKRLLNRLIGWEEDRQLSGDQLDKPKKQAVG
jgi:hypothetical protein